MFGDVDLRDGWPARSYKTEPTIAEHLDFARVRDLEQAHALWAFCSLVNGRLDLFIAGLFDFRESRPVAKARATLLAREERRQRRSCRTQCCWGCFWIQGTATAPDSWASTTQRSGHQRCGKTRA